MAYQMTELTDRVRVGRPSDGTLNLEIWEIPEGWKHSAPEGEMEEVFIPGDALEALFDYLR